MRPPARRDLGASVKHRLLALARERSEELQYLLVRYAIERFLYRLSESRHAERFLLKGATLHAAWHPEAHRPTWDLDLEGIGESSPAILARVFQEVCKQAVESDGLTFEAGSVRTEPTREEGIYQGVRIHLTGHLGKARVPLQVDIGFGDPVTPGPVELEYPVLLDFPSPRLRAYPPETVVAEKVETLAALGMKNSRMKDIFDLWYIAGHFDLDGAIIQRALRATFHARRLPIPSTTPTALTSEFSRDASKGALWRGFLAKSGLTAPTELGAVMDFLADFILPPLIAPEGGFTRSWARGGPWR
jgi:predicted nucleotidyltransferase component of viral defense system